MIYHAHEQYGCIDIHAIRISVDLIQTHPHYYITLIFSVNSVVNHAQNSLKYIILDASDVSGKSTHSLILAQLPVWGQSWMSTHPGANFVRSLRSTSSSTMHIWDRKLCVPICRLPNQEEAWYIFPNFYHVTSTLTARCLMLTKYASHCSSRNCCNLMIVSSSSSFHFLWLIIIII